MPLHLLASLVVTSVLLTGIVAEAAAQDPPRSIGAWDKPPGSHRVRLSVLAKADAVRAHIVWRRPDQDPDR